MCGGCGVERCVVDVVARGCVVDVVVRGMSELCVAGCLEECWCSVLD